jgi:Tol biopolymer transport system component
MRNIKFNLFCKSAFFFKPLFIVLLLTGVAATAFSQMTDIFPVPDTYKTEGIPVIKNSEVGHLFYDPSSIKSNLIWDADRENRRLLVTDETNNVYLLDSALAQPVKLIEKVVPQSVKINPNGESFAYISDHENEDNYQLYLYDFKTKATKKLVNLTGKDESIESVMWNEKGNALYYVRIDYDLKISKLCSYDFVAEKCFEAELKGIWNAIDVKNNRVLLKYWKASTSQLLYYFDLQSNKLTAVDEKGNSRKAFFVGYSIYWNSEGNENCRQEPCVLILNLKNNKTEQLTLPKDILSISEVRVSPEGKNLMIQETKNGIDRLRVFQLKKD